jgi:hypothetical protein
MRSRTPFVVVLALVLVLAVTAGYGLGRRENPAQVSAAQPAPATWNSTMIWQPTLEDAGIALAELVNQIDASCSVDVDPVVPANGEGPEGPVYAFAVTWTC